MSNAMLLNFTSRLEEWMILSTTVAKHFEMPIIRSTRIKI
jgi:hypothetical protein